MYLALYRKWRPKTFDDVIGQEHITKTLKNEVISNKTAHAYLFTGSRGTGKTTCSKILSMAVNCLNVEDGNPCMKCDNCKSILDGSTLDVVEIDAASNNGVDDVRILRDEANYTPAQCKYRVYIIDETHMLSVSAFNALLKIMEEPPQHVKFILATTEVHKVPATVLSRCQRFDFTRIKTEKIAQRLMYISQHENITLQEDASFLIARLADGGMRDALSILDQCIAYSNNVDMDIVSKATGLVLRDYLFDIVDRIEKKDISDVIQCVDDLYQQSKDLQRFVSELIEHYRNLMIVKSSNKPENLVRCLPNELERMKIQSVNIPMVSIMRYLTVLQECLDNIGKNFDKRLSLEMSLVKLCSADMDYNIESLLDRIERLEIALKNGVIISDNQNIQDKNTTVKRQKSKPEQKKDNPIPKDRIDTINISDIDKNVVDMSKTDDKQQAIDVKPLDIWPEIIKMLNTTDQLVAMILRQSTAYVGGDSLFISSDSEMFGSIIKRDNFTKKLKEAIYQKTGKNYKLKVKKVSSFAKNKKDVMEELLSNAKNMGIEVDEK